MLQGIKQVILTVDPHSILKEPLQYDDLIEKLESAQQLRPKFMANSIGVLMDIFEENIKQAPKKYWTQILNIAVCSFESYPSIFKKNFNRVKKLLHLLTLAMASIDQEVSQFWLHPDEGTDFDDYAAIALKDIDSAIILQIRASFDRVISTYDYEKCLQAFLPFVKEQAINSDWRWRAAILMAASQFSECYLHSNSNMTQLIQTFFQKSYDPHPVVRFSSIHAIGQFADDLKPEFQNIYSEKYLEVFMTGFEDPVDRVAAHWIACSTNFFEDYGDSTVLTPYLEKILEGLIYYINSGNSTIKENSVSLLATLGTIDHLFTQQSIRKPFQICNMIFQNFDLDGPFKQFVNQTLECVSIFLSKHLSLCQDYVGQFFMVMEMYGDKFSPTYYCSAFHRILLCKIHFPQWKILYAKAFKMIKEAQLTDVSELLAFIPAIASELKSEFNIASYETISYLRDLLSQQVYDDKVVESVIDCISNIMTKCAPADPNPEWYSLVYQVLQSLVQSIFKLTDDMQYGPLKCMYSGLGDILKEYQNVLSPCQCSSVGIALLENTEKLQSLKKNASSNDIEMEEQDDEQVQKAGKDITQTQLSDCICESPQVLFILLRKASTDITQQEFSNKLIHLTFNSIQMDKKKDHDYLFCFAMMKNVLQHIKFDLISGYLDNFYQVIKNQLINPKPQIRSSALVALQSLISALPQSAINSNIITDWVEQTKKAFITPISDQFYQFSQKQDKKMKEQCICVIGFLMKYHHSEQMNLFYLYKDWLSELPLKNNNLTKSHEQFEIFAQTYRQFLQYIYSKQSADFLNCLTVVIKVLIRWKYIFEKKSKKISDSSISGELRQTIKENIQTICQEQVFINSKHIIFNSLNGSQRQTLNQILSEAY